MWHVSIENKGNIESIKKMARQVIFGVGDKTKGEWEQITPIAYHYRRRLSDKEDAKIGPAIDIRGTEEEKERLEKLKAILKQ